MSLSNITVPNNYELHCDILDVGAINNDSQLITSNSDFSAKAFRPTLTTTLDAAAINWFSQGILITNLTGATTIANVPFYIWRLGQLVNISWKEHTNPAAASGQLTSSLALPTYARPTANTVKMFAVVLNVSAEVAGLCTVDPTGIITFYVEDASLGNFGPFTNSGNCGLRSGSISYYIN